MSIANQSNATMCVNIHIFQPLETKAVSRGKLFASGSYAP